jgi:ketosteroid isomerase-like protein
MLHGTEGGAVGERENTELVKQAYQHFKNGDIQSFLGLLSEDVEWTLFEIEGVPFSGTRRGSERVGEFYSQVFDTEEVLHFEPRELVAEGDKVVVLGDYAWRVKSTGREYESDFVHVITVRDGKVARFQEFMDTAVVGEAYRGS